MLIRIARIESCGPDQRGRLLVFDDGREPRRTAAAVVKALALEEGGEHDSKRLTADLEEAEEQLVKERAMGIIGYRERSTRELEKRLIDDGYPAGLSRKTVARFVELGLVDDQRFASMWARSKASAGMGPERIRRELSMKGVAPLVIIEALDEAFGDEDLVEQARQSLRGRVPDTKKEREKLIRKLVTRGFSLSVALAALDETQEK